MFKRQKRFLLLQKKHSLILFQPDSQSSATLEFPPNTVDLLAVLDIASFSNLVSEFFKTNNLHKQSGVILLSEGIIFKKTLGFVAGTNYQDLEKDFAQRVPIEPDKLTTKHIINGNQVLLLAAPTEISNLLIHICSQFELVIEAVIPSESIGPEESIAKIQLRQLAGLLDKKTLTELNFLNPARQITAKLATNKKGPYLPSGIFKIEILIIALFLILEGLILHYFGLLPFSNKYPQGVVKSAVIAPPFVESASQIPPSPTPSPIPKKEKKDLLVHIINGTGEPDKTIKAITQLKRLGIGKYKSQEATVTGAYETVISFGHSVPEELKEPIIQAMKRSFLKVATQSGSFENNDMIITTGK